MAIEQVVGQPCFKISHNRERPCYEAGEECAVKEVFEFGEPRTIMHKHQGEEGVLYVETKAYPMMDGSGVITAAIEVIHNVTERYLLEAEQLKTQKLEAIGTLAGGIAHDFNNLLQGVFGYLSVAKMFAKQPEKLVEILEQAEEAMALSVNLTTQLLTFAKGGNPSKQKLNLKPLIENATKFALSGSRCGHQLHLAPDLWLVEVDKGQISQVVQNIVLNASEAMPEGGVVEILSENLNLPQGGRRIRIVIKDTGIGIPASHRAKIFDPYFTTKQKGSGLGLATSYSIVKNHGGSIEVGSAPSEGSTFSIILPACEPEVAVDEELQPAVLGSDQKWRLLLMDDEATVRDVAQSMLDMLGHDLQLACHGAEALGKYQEGMLAGKPFDLVILDLTIKGGMGGEETIKRLLEIDPKACVVVSSGYSDSLVVANYRDYGFKGILNKPYNLKGLQECLARVLG
jgi:signal transduction histidine kinase/ActR/RegA family two-component response regulator